MKLSWRKLRLSWTPILASKSEHHESFRGQRFILRSRFLLVGKWDFDANSKQYLLIF